MTSEEILLREPWPFCVDIGERSGWLYILRASTGLYKIGRSKDVRERLKQIRSHFPYNCQLVAVLPTCCMAGTEGKLHKQFRRKRVYGEWFALTQEDVSSLDWYDLYSWPQGLS